MKSLPRFFYVSFAGKRYEVASVEDAATKWNAFRERTAAGCSQIGNGVAVRNERDYVIATVSYNGRIWGPDGAPWSA